MKDQNNDGIDLIALIKFLWSSKKVIFRWVIGFFLVGLIHALFSPNEYQAKIILLPEVKDDQNALSGALRNLSGIAGINLTNLSGSNQFNPELYSQIVESTPFYKELMGEKFYFEKVNSEISLYTYLSKYSDKTLFSKLFAIPFRFSSFLKSLFSQEEEETIMESKVSLSSSELDVIKDLKRRLEVYMDWEIGLLKIKILLQDKKASVEVANFVKDYISEFVVDYATAKEVNNLNFIESQFNEAKGRFLEAQFKLAKFSDKNRDIISSSARIEEERIKSEYNLTFNLYNGLALELEQAKIKINEVTPVFTEIDPAIIPVDEEHPKRLIIVLSFTFIGFLLTLTFLLIKKFIVPQFVSYDQSRF